ncbi:MAG TPA: hypothetical protein G4N96_01175 [Chloroflexi bacterium]|nr:hypothetical protein [Chloroflexota bacterium]
MSVWPLSVYQSCDEILTADRRKEQAGGFTAVHRRRSAVSGQTAGFDGKIVAKSKGVMSVNLARQGDQI